MTSLQAGHLRRALQTPDRPGENVARVLNRATAKTTYPVWMMNAIGDITFHHAGVDAVPWWWRPSGALFDQLLGAAETEPVLAEWFLRRFSLLDSLYMVPPPRIIGRTIAHNLRLWDQRVGEGTPSRQRPAANGHNPSRPEQLGGLRRNQPDGAVVGRHPGGHPALQRRATRTCRARSSSLRVHNRICGPSWCDGASTSWPRWSPSSASSAAANSSVGVS